MVADMVLQPPQVPQYIDTGQKEFHMFKLGGSCRKTTQKRRSTNSLAQNVHKDSITVEARGQLVVPLVWRKGVR